MNRRTFTNTLALAAGALSIPPLPAAPERKIKIGHTGITWGAFPRPGAEAPIEPAFKDLAAEGFWSFETFPEVLGTLDEKGELAPLIEKYHMPIRSGYITVNLIDPSQRKDEVDRVI